MLLSRTLLCSPCHAVIYTAYRECLRCLAQSYFGEQMRRVATECWTAMAMYGLREYLFQDKQDCLAFCQDTIAQSWCLPSHDAESLTTETATKETGITNDPIRSRTS